MCGPNPTQVEAGGWQFSSQMPIAWHAIDDEVHGKSGSAISTCFNVGIFLVTQCVGVSSFVKFIESTGGGLFAYSDTPFQHTLPWSPQSILRVDF